MKRVESLRTQNAVTVKEKSPVNRFQITMYTAELCGGGAKSLRIFLLIPYGKAVPGLIPVALTRKI